MEFEEMQTNEVFGHLMDDASEKSQHARAVAIELLELALGLEERAEKYRHLAALMVLDAQEFAGSVGDLLAMEFPMDGVEEEENEGLGEEE